MKDIFGYNGIQVTSNRDNNDNELQSVVVELDSETREILNFVKELRNSSAIWNGYALGDAFQDMLEDIASIQSALAEDEYYKQNNPAVRAAWEHYQTMLGLAKEEGVDDET